MIFPIISINTAYLPCRNYLIDYIEDVKKNPEAIYGDHLSHQVVLFASPDAFDFGHGLSTVRHGVDRVHAPLFRVLWQRQLMHHRRVEPRSN